jgi:hypothetical protein
LQIFLACYKRADNLKDYLVNNFPEIDSNRLTINGVNARRKFKINGKLFNADDSINLITTKKQRSLQLRKD